MKAMILAAGKGMRMRPLTATTPKPLLQVGRYTLIEYHLLSLAKAGVKEVVINMSYQTAQFRELLGDGTRYNVKIHYSPEPEDPLDTGGGIYQALPILGNAPFIGLSADLWTDFSFANLPNALTGLAHLVLVDNPAHNLRGDFSLRDGKVLAIGEPKFNFGGIGVYHPQLFANCQPGVFSIVPLLVQAMAGGLVTGEHYQGTWVNVGTIAQLEDLRQQLGKPNSLSPSV